MHRDSLSENFTLQQLQFCRENIMQSTSDETKANDNDGEEAVEGVDKGGVVGCVGTLMPSGVPAKEGGDFVDDLFKDDEDISPPAKRARTDDDTIANDNTLPPGPNLYVKQAVLKYKRKKGTIIDVTYGEDEKSEQQTNTNDYHPLGIKLSMVKVTNAQNNLVHYYEIAKNGDPYRGRPLTASDLAIIVEEVTDSALAKTRGSVKRNDILLLIDGTIVNITDKKRLKYYKARLNNGSRPLKLTFFRPDEGEEEPGDCDEDVTGLYITKYEPPKNPTPPPAQASPVKEKTWKDDTRSKDERSARRAILQRRLDELELLHVETSTELNELRAMDGILVGRKGPTTAALKDMGGEKLKVKGDEDFDIPRHIKYHPPVKLRRKEMPALNQACNKVENLLRQRMAIDREKDKIRDTMQEAQMKLDLKNMELKALDEKMLPALEQVKLLEMEVKDNWKTMYLKLKDYYEKNGHSNVKDKQDSKLAKWCTRQRTCYINAQLETPDPSQGIIKPYQYDLLNRIDFAWNLREQQFSQNIAMLREFKEEHGHTNVPMKHDNLHLANFVQKWRREYRLYQEGKPCNMTPERLKALEEAGLAWRDPSRTHKRSDTRQETWDDFITQLKQFKEKYGHFMINKVNKTLEKGNRMGRLDEFCGWVRKQYTLYKAGSPCQLTDEKVNQLKEMGFWLERSQAHKFAKSPKKTKTTLGELKVPTIDDLAPVIANEGPAAELVGEVTDMMETTIDV